MVGVQMPTPVTVRAVILLTSSLLGIQQVAASTLSKRDTPLATVNIPLTIDKDQRYVLGVNMSSSPQQQAFKFALSLNTGYSAVAGTACDNCDGVPTYNASASSSQKTFPGSANVSIGSASISGPFIKEDCSLHEANGSSWKYPNQTVIVANASSPFFSDITSGLLGLGTNANGLSGDFFDTIFGQWLARNPSRNNFSFGMDLRPPTFTADDDQGNGGVLHWVLPDSSAYEGNVAWTTASVSSGPANTPESSTTANAAFELPDSDWSIELDGWAASISGSSVANATKTQALIELFFPDILFPASHANLLYAAVPSAVQMNSFVRAAQAWSVPCDTALSVAFTFSGQSFPLDQSQLIERQSDGTCIGTIKAWPDPSVSNFMLGSSFMSALYLIYVVGRPGSGVPNSIGMAMRSAQSSKTPVGAIVGGTIGGVVFVAILVIAAYILGRRRRTKSSPPVDNDGRSEIVANHKKDEVSDEGGAQYAVSSLPHYGQQKYSPTTPSTAGITQPLLPEAQDPQSPALSAPYTPYSPVNFLAMSSGTPNTSHTGEPSSTSVGSHISYNPRAFGANVTASRASEDASGRMGTVGPFMLPSGPNPVSIRDQKITPSTSPAPTAQNAQVHQPSAVAVSPQDIDPFSPSTVSGGAVVEPFIIPPPPGPGSHSNESSPSSRAPMVPTVPETPAPPYSAQASDAVSQTLVECPSDSNPGSSVQRQEKS